MCMFILHSIGLPSGKAFSANGHWLGTIKLQAAALKNDSAIQVIDQNFYLRISKLLAAGSLASLLTFATPVFAFDDFFLQGNFGQSNQRRAKAMKELVDQKAFQDRRLESCIGTF